MSRTGTAATAIQSNAIHGEWVGDSDSLAESPATNTSTAVWRRLNPINSVFLPLAVGAVLAGSRLHEFRGHIRLDAETPADFVTVAIRQDEWTPVLEPITNDQVRALNALLAIPYVNDQGFDYFADE